MRAQNPANSTASDALGRPTDTSLLPPVGTVALCLLTIATSIAQSIADSRRWTQAIGVVPAHVLHLSSITSIGEGQVIPVWLTLFTYVYLHGGWWHVLPNMAGLWVFGAIAEPVMGTRRFVLTYVAFGVVGALGIGLVLPHSLKPVTGASLAISGILGAYSALRLSPLHVRVLGPVGFWSWRLDRSWALRRGWFFAPFQRRLTLLAPPCIT